MRFFGLLIAIVMLAVACGGTTVVSRDDALVAAKAEIAELKAQLNEQTVSSDTPTSLVPTTEVQVEKTEVPVNIVESWDVPRTGVSQGPCGAFRLSGTGILELEYDGEDGPYRWVDSGIDYMQMLADEYGGQWTNSRVWAQRPPDVALGFLVAEKRNHFFFMQWWTSFVSLPEWSPSVLSRDISGILGASTVSEAGFLGLDDNCQWGWIPIGSGVGDGSSRYVINSGLTIEDRYSEGWWFKEFVWKDYSCEEAPPPGSTAIYDPERHMFVSECRVG